MKTIEIKERLHHYIETAKEKKLKAIYTMVEDEIAEKYDNWNDADFVAELQKREEMFLNKTSKRFTIGETVSNAMKAIQKTS
jgi:hypothetical protein